MSKFSDKLKQLRIDNGYTQLQLAELAGVRQSNIHAWETGKSAPLPDGLVALADVFGCSIDYLLDRENEAGAIIIENEHRGVILSDDEKNLVKIYRQLTSRRQYMAAGYVSGLLYEQQKGA